MLTDKQVEDANKALKFFLGATLAHRHWHHIADILAPQPAEPVAQIAALGAKLEPAPDPVAPFLYAGQGESPILTASVNDRIRKVYAAAFEAGKASR